MTGAIRKERDVGTIRVAGRGALFEPFQIKGVQFAHQILRSSMGGWTAYYDGTVSPAWRHFEKKFAKTGVVGIVSATIDLDDKRLSPLEYPKLSDGRLIAPLRAGVKEVQQLGCRYKRQIIDWSGTPDDGDSAVSA